MLQINLKYLLYHTAIYCEVLVAITWKYFLTSNKGKMYFIRSPSALKCNSIDSTEWRANRKWQETEFPERRIRRAYMLNQLTTPKFYTKKLLFYVCKYLLCEM